MTERIFVNDPHMLYQWLIQHPFAILGCAFGGAVIAVTVYSYFHDYRLLRGEGVPAKRRRS